MEDRRKEGEEANPAAQFSHCDTFHPYSFILYFHKVPGKSSTQPLSSGHRAGVQAPAAQV